MPVVVEFILERVTNISMGTEIDNIIEFEELARPSQHRRRRPTLQTAANAATADRRATARRNRQCRNSPPI